MRRRLALASLLVACTSARPAPSPAPRVADGPRVTAAPDAAVAPRPNLAAGPVERFADPPPPDVAEDHLLEPDTASDVCTAAESNLTRDLDAVLSQRPESLPASANAPWDHRTPPADMDLVNRRLRLRADERAVLQREGFVVPARLTFDTYAWALHEVYQSQLPLYVSADAVLHAIYVTNDKLIAEVESQRLAPALTQAVDAMHLALVDRAAELPPDSVRDLDLYLTVARSLLRGARVRSGYGNDESVADVVRQIEAASGIAEVALFGRQHLVDFSQYQPRGHYTEAGMARFFRGAMWLSRMEFNVVTRSCRSSDREGSNAETPREALDALALADLAETARVTDSLARIDRVWEVLAGRREDLSLRDLNGLRTRANIASLRAPDAFEKLRAAIGNDFRRTARIHPMAEGCGELPVIATLLGPRVTADTFALRPLTHTEVPDRHRVGVAEVAYVLGHDRARAHLTQDLAAFPTLGAQLDVARGIVANAPPDRSLYGAWLNAIRGLAARPEGARPSYESTDAFADLRVNSAVAAYGQLRHNYVLMAGQAYDEGGCNIPDAYVEPVPAVWDGLIAYTDRALDALDALGEGQSAGAVAWLQRTKRVLRGLRAITAFELANRPLTPEASRWLSMVVEMRPGSSDGPPTYSGWYFDLFRHRQDEGLTDARLIADFYTSWWTNEVSYAGAARPRLGLFVVDTGGPPRMMVGPVAAGYGYHFSTEHRLDDEASHELTDAQLERPWAARYEVSAAPTPPLSVSYVPGDPDAHTGDALTLRSTRMLGAVTVETLDHHRQRLRSVTVRVGRSPTRVPLTGEHGALRVRVGVWDAVISPAWSGGDYTFGAMPQPSRE
ncbi:MAG: DUF3160 domain-containing protein [Polyangiales bacterium]